MTSIVSYLLSAQKILMISQCWLYLKAYFLSDLVTASGSTLSPHAWNGEQNNVSHSNPHHGQDKVTH